VCSNGLEVERDKVERLVLSNLKERLLTPEALARFKLSISSEAVKQLKSAMRDVNQINQRLDNVTKQIGQLVESIKAGIESMPSRNRLHHRYRK